MNAPEMRVLPHFGSIRQPMRQPLTVEQPHGTHAWVPWGAVHLFAASERRTQRVGLRRGLLPSPAAKK